MGKQQYIDYSWINTKNSPPERSKVREWYQAHQFRGVMHKAVEMAARISSTVRKETRELFENNPRISLREVPSEKGVANATLWNISRRELRLFPYKLQMSTTLTEDHVRSRL